jgi:hypothetical protein
MYIKSLVKCWYKNKEEKTTNISPEITMDKGKKSLRVDQPITTQFDWGDLLITNMILKEEHFVFSSVSAKDTQLNTKWAQWKWNKKYMLDSLGK